MAKTDFFKNLIEIFETINDWTPANLESVFKELAVSRQIKPGELQLPLRIMMVGEKSGPPVFEIAALLGKKETGNRINDLLIQTGNW
jgi:glutamyl-tRNA synthetase